MQPGHLFEHIKHEVSVQWKLKPGFLNSAHHKVGLDNNFLLPQ